MVQVAVDGLSDMILPWPEMKLPGGAVCILDLLIGILQESSPEIFEGSNGNGNFC